MQGDYKVDSDQEVVNTGRGGRAAMPKSDSLMPPECESRMLPWCRVQISGFGFRVLGFGFRVSGSVFRV